MKRCSQCHETKHAAEFYVTRRDSETGDPITRRGQCRACFKGNGQKWASNRRESTVPVDREKNTMLPIEPFRAWLLLRLNACHGVRSDLAAQLKTSERRLYAWLGNSTHVHIDSVDQALLNVGDMLIDIYPDLYEFDVESEPLGLPERELNRRMLEMREAGMQYTAISTAVRMYHGAELTQYQVRYRLRAMGVPAGEGRSRATSEQWAQRAA